MEQNRKRIIGGALFLGALTLLLCARLFYIQILAMRSLRRQRVRSMKRRWSVSMTAGRSLTAICVR